MAYKTPIMKLTSKKFETEMKSFSAKLAKKYSKEAAATKAGRPDLSGFSRQSSGMIEVKTDFNVIQGNFNRDTFVFLRLGSGVDLKIRLKIKNEFFEHLNRVIKLSGSPNTFGSSDGFYYFRVDVDGSNWGGVGIARDKSDRSWENTASKGTKAMTPIEDKIKALLNKPSNMVTAAAPKKVKSEIWGVIIPEGAKKSKSGVYDGIDCSGQSLEDFYAELKGKKIISISPYGDKTPDPDANLVVRVGSKKWNASSVSEANRILAAASEHMIKLGAADPRKKNTSKSSSTTSVKPAKSSKPAPKEAKTTSTSLLKTYMSGGKVKATPANIEILLKALKRAKSK